MLSEKERHFLGKKYPLISLSMILVSIVAFVLMLSFVLIFKDDRSGLFEHPGLVVLGLSIILVSIATFFVLLFFRHKVRKHCIAVTHGLAIRAVKNQFDYHGYANVCHFAKDVVVYDVVGMVIKGLSSFAAIPEKSNIPMIFITIKNIEELSSERPERLSIDYLRFKAMGIRKEQWGEVVWTGFRSRARKLLLNETAFTILGFSKAKYAQDKKHLLIRESGVELILEVE